MSNNEFVAQTETVWANINFNDGWWFVRRFKLSSAHFAVQFTTGADF